MSVVILCGSTCGHRHDSVNGPTGCCAEHGPFLYCCARCAAITAHLAPADNPTTED